MARQNKTTAHWIYLLVTFLFFRGLHKDRPHNNKEWYCTLIEGGVKEFYQLRMRTNVAQIQWLTCEPKIPPSTIIITICVTGDRDQDRYTSIECMNISHQLIHNNNPLLTWPLTYLCVICCCSYFSTRTPLYCRSLNKSRLYSRYHRKHNHIISLNFCTQFSLSFS